MCFTCPQVFDSMIEYSVKTIVSVLSSSINCKAIRCGEEAVLSIGCLISCRDAGELMETCGDILGKLKARGVSEELMLFFFPVCCNLAGIICDSLLYAVVKVAVSASSFRHVKELGPVIDVRPGARRTLDLSKLLHYLPKELTVKKGEIPLRLMFWYLDPLVLKNDATQILQESIRRIERRSTILSLAFSPLMFIKTRSLLHNWFLLMGLASLLEFQTKLVSLVLDIISRPMRWGILADDTEEAEPLCSDAARNISWLLNPIGKSHQDVLAQNLVKMAGNFTSKQYGLAKHTNPKKLKRPKIYHVKSAPCAKLGQDMLFRRISWGILIGCSDNVSKEGWEILLHYAATCMILQSANTQDTGLWPKQKSQGMEVSIAWNENSDRKEVEKGVILVFYLTDVVENMSVLLTDSEESEIDFICEVKSKATKYLLKCVYRLLNLNFHEDYALMLQNLHKRLIKWSHQENVVFHGSKDVSEAIEAISKILSSL
ncbi:hypothetical protein ACET3Z_028028 [Daucus carota]